MKSSQIKSTNKRYPSANNSKLVEVESYNDLQYDAANLYPRLISYTTSVPFSGSVIVNYTLTGNDVLTPDPVNAKAGFGAIYRLIGDGSHSPVLTAFKASSSSSAYDSTLNAINHIAFLYDGVDFCYNIYQIS